MGFSESEYKALLSIKGVGPTVIKRLEEMGISSLQDLSVSNTHDIVTFTANMLGSSCWKNSPQAKDAIDNAIAFAKNHVETTPST
jgi:predicted flap endonuclease-1-like 5' DNA nuclease